MKVRNTPGGASVPDKKKKIKIKNYDQDGGQYGGSKL